MDIHHILKEIDQRTTRYELNKGSLQGVLDFDPDLDLESGTRTQELEEKRKTKNCTTKEIGWFICISPVLVGVFILVGFTVYKMVVSALEVSGHYES